MLLMTHHVINSSQYPQVIDSEPCTQQFIIFACYWCRITYSTVQNLHMLLMTHSLLQSSAAEVNSEMYQPGNCLATGESKLSDCAFKCNLFGKSHVWFRLSCCASECHLWRRFPNTLQYLIIHRLMVIHIK